MPYGVRYIAQQMFEELRLKFPYEAQEQLLQITGHWVWKAYIQPALLQPQHWGVVDRGLSPVMNRNLGAVAKVLSQIACGKLFGGEDLYLQPLNSYITEAIDRMQDIWSNMINVRAAEAQFEIDEFNDLFARTKPTLYIKLADVFAIHNLVIDDLPSLCPSQDDPLREIVRELGSAKNNENELLHVSTSEITLTLNPKYHEQEGEFYRPAHLTTTNVSRSRLRYQIPLHGNQALCPIHHPHPDRRQPYRNHDQAHHPRRRSPLGRPRQRRNHRPTKRPLT
jgi:Ras GTPase-activating-like protein IQGAP2/3